MKTYRVIDKYVTLAYTFGSADPLDPLMHHSQPAFDNLPMLSVREFDLNSSVSCKRAALLLHPVHGLVSTLQVYLEELA